MTGGGNGTSSDVAAANRRAGETLARCLRVARRAVGELSNDDYDPGTVLLATVGAAYNYVPAIDLAAALAVTVAASVESYGHAPMDDMTPDDAVQAIDAVLGHLANGGGDGASA